MQFLLIIILWFYIDTVLAHTMIQCERTTALQELHTELLQPPTKIGIIGSGCSVSTEPTAEVSRYYNLTQVSGKLLAKVGF